MGPLELTLEIRLLGPVAVLRHGEAVALPRSRKVRSLLALLALAPAPMSRTRLCDLLWDVPNDPRGELRWCLSKLRSVLDDADRRRVVTTGQSLIGLDLSDCRVDALELERTVAAGVANAATPQLEEVSALAAGDLLEGAEVDGAELVGWLSAQRQRYRAMQAAVASELATRAPVGSDDRFRWLDGWLRLAPHEPQAHRCMIDSLIACGRIGDAEAHVNATIRAFEHDGIDWAPLRETWRDAAARARTHVVVAPPPVIVPAAHVRQVRRGSVVVMPFVDATPGTSQVAHGVTDDVITRLAKLRVLFVIARGTSYALRERGVDVREAGRILNVEYVVSGSVRRHGDRIHVTVELADTRDAGIIWTDEFAAVPDETFAVLDSIVDRIVAAVSEEIEREESKRALQKPPSSLDAWEAYHRGLWHMYRFTGPDNAIAARLFDEALRIDPTFARAHAMLSFTHFQNVFLDLVPDRDAEMARAIETASASLAADDRDPAAHWAMGRALWLRSDPGAVAELERSIELSPNFALGHYTLGFVQSQSGDPRAAVTAAEWSRQLSPFDPLQFGMLGTRALAQMRLGERQEAVQSALKAATRPNAHVHILAIAAVSLGLAERRDEARTLVGRIRQNRPSYTIESFVRAFRLNAETEALCRAAAKQAGFD